MKIPKTSYGADLTSKCPSPATGLIFWSVRLAKEPEIELLRVRHQFWQDARREAAAKLRVKIGRDVEFVELLLLPIDDAQVQSC